MSAQREPTGRPRSVGGHEIVALDGWHSCSVAPGSVEGPDALECANPRWIPHARPAPVASVLRDAGEWSLDGAARRFDAEEWWCRARFGRVDAADEVSLVCDGLATLADVWMNGAPLLSSDNMFLSHERRIDPLLADENELLFRFRPLDAALGLRRPRPRWRAPMVEHQQLRWMRATLLGRTPGWSPPAAVVGPWRSVRLERRRGIAVDDVRVSASLVGGAGRVEVTCVLRPLRGAAPSGVDVIVERGGIEQKAQLAASAAGTYAGHVEVTKPDLWWPHTHGDPALYRLRLVAHCPEPVTIDLGSTGFRDVKVAGDFALAVNGVPLFCRGACWTPLDPVTLVSDRPAYAAALAQARDAGMNMLRVGGTMAYESGDFYDLADETGILVWQDFMFANMDYPDDDPSFVASVEAEARQLLGRLQGRPSIAVLCGNSEIEQQAAMWGAPRERWAPRLFHEVLPRLCAAGAPGVPYWPSSAHGGAFPHDATVGTTSYYGVGAYLRPLDDARRADVRFATECLAFANVPDDAHLPGGPSVRVTHAAWKGRTPRDLGAGWDFDDVRDHYLADLFRVDPMRLRYADHDRYLALSRVVTGEVMASAMGEWRRKRTTCRGALIWFLRDLWTSAGWGVVDADGRPKAAYHYLRRALQPVGLHVTDEGGSGLAVHLVNERVAPVAGELHVALFRRGEVEVASARRAVVVPARDAVEILAGDLFEGFIDVNDAYRFGPPSHDLVVATLVADGRELAQAFSFPCGLPSERAPDVGLTAAATARGDGDVDLLLRTRAFAQSVAIVVDGFASDEDFLHIAPGSARTVRLRRRASGPLRGHAQPLNADISTKISLTPQ